MWLNSWLWLNSWIKCDANTTGWRWSHPVSRCRGDTSVWCDVCLRHGNIMTNGLELHSLTLHQTLRKAQTSVLVLVLPQHAKHVYDGSDSPAALQRSLITVIRIIKGCGTWSTHGPVLLMGSRRSESPDVEEEQVKPNSNNSNILLSRGGNDVQIFTHQIVQVYVLKLSVYLSDVYLLTTQIYAYSTFFHWKNLKDENDT